jgi:hypothetical protein
MNTFCKRFAQIDALRQTARSLQTPLSTEGKPSPRERLPGLERQCADGGRITIAITKRSRDTLHSRHIYGGTAMAAGIVGVENMRLHRRNAASAHLPVRGRARAKTLSHVREAVA